MRRPVFVVLAGTVLAALRRVVDPVAEPGPGRISFGAVTEIGMEITVDLEQRDAPTAAVERWLATEIVGRVPGGRR